MKQTIISSGNSIQGTINTSDDLVVFGKTQGKIEAKNSVIVEAKGYVTGQVIANSLFVKGVFEGNAECDIVHIMEGGKVIGDILSTTLIIDKKAFFEGNNKIKKNMLNPSKDIKYTCKEPNTDDILL
ncbi:bactofilin family protein [Sulfurospirillum arcachonense]|uniref:bactofilin family protein n=1 Tax=Sulfurospirillum arcachonense TaxID=57666 RepID=UPI00046840CC|nr:polymer-forming cytoskeletal protein [Sulfurospirillum arcachonense]